MEQTPPKLVFHHNWNNKLDCTCFTTIRLMNNSRYFPGAIFDIELIQKGEVINKGRAQVHVAYKTLINDLKDYHCMIDTGYPKDETINIIRTMYKNKPTVDVDRDYFSIVILKKINTSQDPVKVLQPKKTMYESCPKCNAAWKWQEVQAQSCQLCGYPDVENDNY